MIGAIIGDLVAQARSLAIPEDATISKDALAVITTTQALLDYYRGGNFKESLHKHFSMYPDICDLAIVSVPIGLFAKSENIVILLVQETAEVFQSNSDSIKNAQAVAVAVYLAKQPNMKKDYISYAVRKYYGSDTSSETYLAMQAFFQSASFVDALSNALSLGKNALITGAIAFPYYFVEDRLSLCDETESLYYRCKKCLALDHWCVVRDFLETIDPYAQADRFFQDYL